MVCARFLRLYLRIVVAPPLCASFRGGTFVRDLPQCLLLCLSFPWWCRRNPPVDHSIPVHRLFFSSPHPWCRTRSCIINISKYLVFLIRSNDADGARRRARRLREQQRDDDEHCYSVDAFHVYTEEGQCACTRARCSDRMDIDAWPPRGRRSIHGSFILFLGSDSMEIRRGEPNEWFKEFGSARQSRSF